MKNSQYYSIVGLLMFIAFKMAEDVTFADKIVKMIFGILSGCFLIASLLLLYNDKPEN